MARRFQVVIVGGGPVGVALAVQLGMRGVTCGLVETRTDSGRIPKGQNLTHRTLETFYFMGLVDELRAVRLMPPGFAIGEITTYRDLNSPYFHAPQGRSMVHDYYFQRNDRLPQYQMEKVLRAKMDALPGVEACDDDAAERNATLAELVTALDAAGSANVPVRIVLPFAAGKFRETSVVDRPDPAYWGKLYDRLIADAQARDALIELENQSPSHEAYTLANERILREARSWAASFPQNGSPRLLALLVWNGVPRDKDDATEHFRRAAAATGFACETVQTLPER